MDYEEFLPPGVKPTLIFHLRKSETKENIQLGLFDGGVFLYMIGSEKETFAAGRTFASLSVEQYHVPLLSWVVFITGIVLGAIMANYTTQLQTNPAYPFLLGAAIMLIVLGVGGLVRSLYLVALIEFRASIGTTSITKRSRNPAMAARFKEFVRESLKHK